MKREKWTYDNTPKKPGRPRKGEDAERLVVRLAEENGRWGYTRIAGELKKLGHRASPSYVRDVLNLIHDRDTVFLPFDGVLATEDLKIVKAPPRTPMCLRREARPRVQGDARQHDPVRGGTSALCAQED